MGANEHPFKTLPAPEAGGELRALLARERAPDPHTVVQAFAPMTARLHGFDLRGAPLLAGLVGRDGELLPARTTVALRRDMVGAQLLVLFENADPMLPIVTGVIQQACGDPGQVQQGQEAAAAARSVAVIADGERLTFTAEREIVLRCGDASIVLTRSGKVVIRGSYILSRSTGYNKIKGAAIDIN